MYYLSRHLVRLRQQRDMLDQLQEERRDRQRRQRSPQPDPADTAGKDDEARETNNNRRTDANNRAMATRPLSSRIRQLFNFRQRDSSSSADSLPEPDDVVLGADQGGSRSNNTTPSPVFKLPFPDVGRTVRGSGSSEDSVTAEEDRQPAVRNVARRVPGFTRRGRSVSPSPGHNRGDLKPLSASKDRSLTPTQDYPASARSSSPVLIGHKSRQDLKPMSEHRHDNPAPSPSQYLSPNRAARPNSADGVTKLNPWLSPDPGTRPNPRVSPLGKQWKSSGNLLDPVTHRAVADGKREATKPSFLWSGQARNAVPTIHVTPPQPSPTHGNQPSSRYSSGDLTALILDGESLESSSPELNHSYSNDAVVLQDRVANPHTFI